MTATNRNFSVSQWVELFKSIGLTELQMQNWHQEFETKYPDVHASFLTWLGLEPTRIQEIRGKYAK
jgi:hypothetical protein